jgi:hypothetical protein
MSCSLGVRALFAATLALSLAGCVEPAAEPVVVDMRATAPEVANGFQLRFPEKVIAVGADVQTCFVPDIEFDEDVYVVQADAYQGDVGHHVQIYGSAVPRRPGEFFDCSDLSVMSSLLPLVTPNHPLKESDNSKQLPENFYVKIPAGSRIVMQSHYVNYTDSDINTADIVNFETVADVAGMTEASFFVLSHNTFTVPEGPSTVVYECDVEADTQLLYAMGHMHEQGKSISLERLPAGSNAPELLYEVDTWTSEFRDDAPTNAYPPSEPLVLNAGDHLTLTCNFENATGEELPWPREMCVMFTAYWPARGDGFLLCE